MIPGTGELSWCVQVRRVFNQKTVDGISPKGLSNPVTRGKWYSLCRGYILLDSHVFEKKPQSGLNLDNGIRMENDLTRTL